MHSGSCLCGAVSFDVAGNIPAPTACHCTQCRKQSGHFWASSVVPRAAITLRGAEKLTWFQSSPNVRRGFCAVCGSFLFWDPGKPDTTEIAMGAFDAPTQTKLAEHVWVAEKGDYYEITDGLPQRER